MGMIISCHGVDKKYILINFYFILIDVSITLIESLIKSLAKEKAIEKDENLLVFQYLIRYAGFSLFIIPEYIVKKNSSLKKTKSRDFKYKYKLKDFVIIGIIALIMLINQFADIFLNIFQWKREELVKQENKFVWFFLFIFITCTLLVKYKFYRHQYLSTIIILILGIIKDIFKLSHQNYKQYSSAEIKVIFILNIIECISLSFYLTYSKILIDKYYFSPYKVCYLFGFINGSIFFIINILLSFIPCNNSFCLLKYNNKKYFDNYKFFFFNLNLPKKILYLMKFLHQSIYFVFINIFNIIF